MGQLTAFDLQPLIKKHNLKVYFETGTGIGVSLRHALQYNFEKFYSVDIDKDLINNLLHLQNENKNLVLVGGYSKDALKQILPKIPESTSILFFLDAHFPGADFHKISYEESIRKFKKDAFPLEEEISLIKEMRGLAKDVFVIDDYMLYDKEGDYDSIKEGVVWEYEWLQKELGLETDSSFLYKTFSATHTLQKDLRHQGYLLITPKEQSG
jgi:hypothetical protein